MNQFPFELLQPTNAVFYAKIFKNDFLKMQATLFYTIEINLAEIELENKKINTSLYLDFIRLTIYKLQDLENRIFEFPINPSSGFIEGSVYLFDVHNPVDVRKIKFSTIKNNSIDATLYFDINFEYENTGYSKLNNCALKLDLQFGELSIDTEIMSAENFDEKTANEIVSAFSDLNNYEKPILQDQQIIYRMNNSFNSILKK